MPRLWDLLDDVSKAVCRKVAGRRWRDPDTKPVMDELPVDISREMTQKPRGNAALLGGGHGL